MSRKGFLRLDHDSIHADDMAEIVGATNLSTVDAPESCFAFTFHEMEIDHAALLMGRNKDRFGHDIRHYLRSATGFFQDTPNGFVTMPDGGTDFKRRYSEDLGVAIGSLFMVGALRMKWETIAHIPATKTIKGLAKTPDFIGFTEVNQKRVFECKGTTLLQDVDKVRNKAKQQLDTYREAGVRKFALVTYLPISGKAIPPYLFVSDPPLELPTVSFELCVGLHYLHVAEYSGLEETFDALQEVLAARVPFEEHLTNEEEFPWRIRQKYRPLAEYLSDAFQRESDKAETEKIDGEEFIGLWRTTLIGKKTVKVFTGIHRSRIESVIAMLQQPPGDRFGTVSQYESFGKAIVSDTTDLSFNLFGDGTLFLVATRLRSS